MAYEIAKDNRRVKAEVIEVQEYPDLGRAYAVRSVPKTVINGTHQIIGAAPEDDFVYRVMSAVGLPVDPSSDPAEEPPPTSPAQ